MFDSLFDRIKEEFISVIMTTFENVFISPNISNAGDMVSQTPSGFSETSLTLAENINEYVILPVAGVILTYVMVLELITLVTDYNNMHEHTTEDLYKWFFKTFIAVLFVSNAFEITTAVIEAGSSIVQQAIPYASGQEGDWLVTMEQSLTEYGFGELLLLFLMVLLSAVLVWLAQIFIWVVIITRFMNIYMNLSVSAIPLATMTSEKMNGTGINYIKNMIAIGLQGLVIIVALAVYGAMSATPLEIGSFGDGILAVLQVVIKPLILTFALLVVVIKSKSIANSIVGAY